MRKKVLLLYPYYWPFYRAGGPVQSLFNLVAHFKDQFYFYTISLNKDINGEEPLHRIDSNTWSIGPNGENIYFTSFISPLFLLRIIRSVKPDVILINGMFHWHTTLFGLLLGRMNRTKLILSPRGMLQDWGLKRGKIKKKVFLKVLRFFLGQSSSWHATDQQEKKDIIRIFGSKRKIHLASNIPRSLGQRNSLSFPDESGKIKLVFLSLINPNKNLHLIIDAVTELGGNYALDIYGPIMDQPYWDLCRSKMVSSAVSYKGSVPPWEVPKIISSYHFFVLPTQGENFGHAIFDALASGVPVLISRHTPWQNIESKKAGFYINDTNNSHTLVDLMKKILLLSDDAYNTYRTHSFTYAEEYLFARDYAKEYEFLNEP